MSKVPEKYLQVLNELKEKIRHSRLKAVLLVNQELLSVYWEIGKAILEQQKEEGWGKKIIDRLSLDLKNEFPDFKGLSVRNLKYMRAFAEAYPDFAIVQAPLAQVDNADSQSNTIMQASLAQLSWYHHITLLDKIKDLETRMFYLRETIQNGWSRDMMVHQIESGLHNRKGKIQSNFHLTIPEKSELVQQLFNDPYKFEFIYLAKEAKERDLEDALVNQLTKFLLELGQHFAFLGRQYKVLVGDKEYFFDLLFYHTRLKRYIVIDLKIDDFKPEYKGKMEFYLNVADENLKQSDDEKSIGIILCKTKDNLIVEYALRDSSKPIGIAEYKLNEMLPENIRGELPTVEELEAEIERGYEEFKTPADKKLKRIKEIISQLKTDEVKEKRSAKSCKTIFEKVMLPLKHNLEKALKETTNEFAETQWMIWMGNIGFRTEAEAKEELRKKEEVGEIRIELRLNGFKKAGAKAFEIGGEIAADLQQFHYRIGKRKFDNEILLEKVYHLLPTKSELNTIEEAFKVALYTQLEQNLERIRK